MHPALRQVLDRTVDLFRADSRVLAAFHSGSIGTEHEDEYSDVDPVFVVAAEAFGAVDSELPAIFGKFCQTVHLWWPERGNNDYWRNYACLFEADGALLQYDVTVMKPPTDSPIRVTQSQLLFDKAGLLEVISDRPQYAYSPLRLLWTVQRYWLYVFIHAKYLRRGDPFKLVFAQGELFQDHLEVLRASHGQVAPVWWPLVAKTVVTAQRHDAMLLYLGSVDRDSVLSALPGELDAFSRDARAACSLWGVPYPEELEATVRAHLRT
jgi:hypothetical protein